MVIPKQKNQRIKSEKTVYSYQERLIVCLLFEEASLHFIKEMAKNCLLKQKRSLLPLKKV